MPLPALPERSNEGSKQPQIRGNSDKALGGADLQRILVRLIPQDAVSIGGLKARINEGERIGSVPEDGSARDEWNRVAPNLKPCCLSARARIRDGDDASDKRGSDGLPLVAETQPTWHAGYEDKTDEA